MRLELETYVVPETHCNANPHYISSENIRAPEIETGINHFFAESPDQIMVFLTVRNEQNISDEDPYEFDIEMFGTFNVVYEEGEGREHLAAWYPMLVVNGAQMLYSGARDHLHTVTGKGPYGALVLPTAYLSDKGIEFKAVDRPDESSDKT
ncbi:MAG: preprotein translocase subunit SecB [Marinobacter maritimus]|jgi:preprotein translocase subunit SecB